MNQGMHRFQSPSCQGALRSSRISPLLIGGVIVQISDYSEYTPKISILFGIYSENFHLIRSMHPKSYLYSEYTPKISILFGIYSE